MINIFFMIAFNSFCGSLPSCTNCKQASQDRRHKQHETIFSIFPRIAHTSNPDCSAFCKCIRQAIQQLEVSLLIFSNWRTLSKSKWPLPLVWAVSIPQMATLDIFLWSIQHKVRISRLSKIPRFRRDVLDNSQMLCSANLFSSCTTPPQSMEAFRIYLRFW